MINKQQIIAELDQSTNNLIEEIENCKEDDFNKNPAENCWSAAQVMEHILLLETMVNFALKKAGATERAVDLKMNGIKKGLENLDKKYPAPDFIFPNAESKHKASLIEGLKKQRELLKQIIESTDLTETPDYKHPVIGDMTRLEWIYFNIHHAERHIKQLKKIASQIV